MDGQSAQPAPQAPPAIRASLARVESLVREIIGHAGFDLKASFRQSDGAEKGTEDSEFVVDLSGPDSELLLERNGELLNALEYVVLRAARLDEETFGRIALDCEGWRNLRAEELKLMARVAADRVAESGAPFPLGAMNPRERRIIHLALRDIPDVRTESEGFGAERKVVVFPASSFPPRRR